MNPRQVAGSRPREPLRLGGSSYSWIKLCSLLRIEKDEVHGYQLLEDLRAAGARHIDSSALYRTLRRMERERLVDSTWSHEGSSGPGRRLYRLTEAGRTELEASLEEVRQHHETCTKILASRERTSQTSRGSGTT